MQSIAIKFKRIVLGEHVSSDIVGRDDAERAVRALLRDDTADSLRRLNFTPAHIETLQKLVFMSHKTGDTAAEREARYISSKHKVAVYMAEWDGAITDPGSPALPDHIMQAIRVSRGFLVHVIARIADSMWIGYEVGGAHVLDRPRARIMYNAGASAPPLPAVVGALDGLDNEAALDSWIKALWSTRLV